MIINRVVVTNHPVTEIPPVLPSKGFGWKPAKMCKVFNKEIINEFDH